VNELSGIRANQIAWSKRLDALLDAAPALS